LRFMGNAGIWYCLVFGFIVGMFFVASLAGPEIVKEETCKFKVSAVITQDDTC